MPDVEMHLADSILSGDEKRYLGTVRHEGRLREYVAGRILARQLAGRILSCLPQDVPLTVLSDGSLELSGTAFSISLAHSHQGVCAAVAEGIDVGIDLETIQPRHPDLYKFIFHPDEFGLMDDAPLNRDELLILCWTLKEATLKGMKTGFRCSPKKLRLSIDFENEQASITSPGNTIWIGNFEKKDSCYLTVAHPE